MHLADYQTPSRSVPLVTPVDADSPFDAEADERRIAVVVQCTGDAKSQTKVYLAGTTAPSYILRGTERVELPALYVGPIRVEGQAVVTEFLRHNI